MDWFADYIRIFFSLPLSLGLASRGSVNEQINIDVGAGSCQFSCQSPPGAEMFPDVSPHNLWVWPMAPLSPEFP